MTDIALVWNAEAGRGDWTIADGGVAMDGGLQTAVLVSLFTWRVAEPGYRAPAGSAADRHGWWADTFEGTPLGSRLWQLRRAVKSDANALLARARDLALEALEWMLDDGVASAVRVNVRWGTATALFFTIEVEQPERTSSLSFGWTVWAGQGT